MLKSKRLVVAMALGCLAVTVVNCARVQTADAACLPVIYNDPTGYAPHSGCPGTFMEILADPNDCGGTSFLDEYLQGLRYVEVIPTSGGFGWNDAVELPVTDWTSARIEVRWPNTIFGIFGMGAGDYAFRVVTEHGPSAFRVFSLHDCGVEIYADPTHGACAQVLDLNAIYGDFISFGAGSPMVKMFIDYESGNKDYGVKAVIDVVSSGHTYTVDTTSEFGGTASLIRFRFMNFFQDDGDTLEDRNFIKDVGETGHLICGQMGPGTYAIFVRYVFFKDVVDNDTYDADDTITQVVTSDPVYYELTNVPLIIKATPRKVNRFRLMKIIGNNFGVLQDAGDKVMIGGGAHYNNDIGLEQDRIRKWSNTQIVFRVRVYSAWQDKIRFVWVVKEEVKSNAYKIKILNDPS